MSSSQIPAPIYNTVGQTALSWRVTTYASSLARMRAGLHSFTIPTGVNAGTRPLARLTTRDSDDPVVAFLDVWAVVLDVLCFYQERIANEGFLRTATELLSVQALADSLGYSLLPGVAASTYLAFTVDTSPGAPTHVQVPAGTRVQSVPGPGQLPQTFETTVDLTAHAAWNQLLPQLSQPQVLTVAADGTLQNASLYVQGQSLPCRPGDLLAFHTQNGVSGTVRVTQVTPNFQSGYLRIDIATDPELARYPAFTAASAPAAPATVKSVPPQTPPSPPAIPQALVTELLAPKLPLTAANVQSQILGRTWDEPDLASFLRSQGWPPSLLLAQVQAAQAAQVSLDRVCAFGQRVGFFGGDAPPFSTLPTPPPGSPYAAANSSWDDASGRNCRTIWQDSWGNPYGAGSPSADLFLDRQVAELLPGTRMLIVDPDGSILCVVSGVVNAMVMGYGRVSQVTGVKLQLTAAQRQALPAFLLRQSVAYVQSQELPLFATLPLSSSQAAAVTTELPLAGLLLGLQSGQKVAISGQRADAPGVPASEVATLGDIRHTGGYTTIYFAPALQNSYLPATLSVNANVVAATHGQTVVNEVMGSGDGSAENQTFSLRQGPLTYVPADNQTGCQSTLQVRVNNVLWTEVPSLFQVDGNSQSYMVRTDSTGTTRVIFGDGTAGARLPTGQNNVVASYRIGNGRAGLVPAGSLQLLMTRPLGIRQVQNPVAATGAADPQAPADIKQNAPLSVATLGRVVSLADYQAFASGFAGIAKAKAESILSGGIPAVHLTLAASGGLPLSAGAPTYQNLLKALFELGDPNQLMFADDYQPRVFRISARLVLNPLYDSQLVLGQVIAALSSAFSFAARDFAQPVRASEIIGVVQQVQGVTAVLLQQLYFDKDVPALNTELAAAAAYVDAQGKTHPAELLLLYISPQDVEVAS